MRALVLWSGGIESTSMLKMLLEHRSDVGVFVHYVARESGTRHVEETRSVYALLREFQKIRPFTFYHSTVKLARPRNVEHKYREGGLPFDFEVDYPLSIHLIRAHKIDIAYRCRCLEDDWNHVQYVDGEGNLRLRVDPPVGVNQDKRIAPLRGLGYDDPRTLAAFPDVYQLPKAWHWWQLGRYARMTWSCRVPVNDKACGHCHSCLERYQAMNGSSAIADIACRIVPERLMRLTDELVQGLTRTRFEYDEARVLQSGAGEDRWELDIPGRPIRHLRSVRRQEVRGPGGELPAQPVRHQEEEAPCSLTSSSSWGR